MSWKVTSRWAPADADAAAYITAVEAADTAAGQSGGLEQGVKIAIDNFVLGCKADGIWTAIKASCILAGARTLSGALVPLVGTAPTNNNFVSGDYNRKTGLVGNGSTKYLDSNQANNSDPQNNKHVSVYASTLPTSSPRPMLGLNRLGGTAAGATLVFNTLTRLNSTTSDSFVASAGFIGVSRSASASYSRRNGGASSEVTRVSDAPQSVSVILLADAILASPQYSDARLAFYSIGEALNLALLDARVTALINALSAAIP